MEFGSPPPSARFHLAVNRGVVDERRFGLVEAPVVCASTGSSHGAGSLMTFTGSAATATGGSFGESASRVYAYDEHLQFLPPPWFPSIDDTYTTAFFREVTP